MTLKQHRVATRLFKAEEFFLPTHRRRGRAGRLDGRNSYKGSTMKFRKKPVVIEAVQYNGRNMTEIMKFARGASEFEEDFTGASIAIKTLEGTMTASKGDWIIKGVKGEFYPCKNDVFAATYEKVEDQ